MLFNIWMGPICVKYNKMLCRRGMSLNISLHVILMFEIPLPLLITSIGRRFTSLTFHSLLSHACLFSSSFSLSLYTFLIPIHLPSSTNSSWLIIILDWPCSISHCIIQYLQKVTEIKDLLSRSFEIFFYK